MGLSKNNIMLAIYKDVKILPLNQRAATEAIKKKRLNELNAVGIDNFPTNDSMWNNCFNIQFEPRNVVFLENFLEKEIQLNRGQFRFSLYDLEDSKHRNILKQINNINCK